MSLNHIYKDWDYRCLVPDSHQNPEKWRTYDVAKYRSAFDKESFSKVETFKHDKYFNNWIDPKVLKSFTSHPSKAWKRSYGFNNVNLCKWNGTIGTTYASRCWWKCAYLVIIILKSFFA